MWVKALLLRNFRSYEEAQFTFSPQNNLIVGQNARGKTTILEAIYLLITGRSFRTSNLEDLVREGERGFYVELFYERQGIDHAIRFIYEKKQKRIFANDYLCRSTSDLLGLLQGALLLPDDVQLIKGGPKLRRRFLDLQLAQVNPLYVYHLARYYRAMRQRNALLKKQSSCAIDIFEKEMALSGSYLISQRLQAVELLKEDCQCVQKTLSSGKEEASLKYLAKNQPQTLLEQFESMRAKEMKIGSTLVGPHLDDLSLKLGNREARLFASEGQSRSLTAALKFAEWKQLDMRSESGPLMMIDDLGISLDPFRRMQMTALLDGFGQVFVTSSESIELISKERHTQYISLSHHKSNIEVEGQGAQKKTRAEQ